MARSNVANKPYDDKRVRNAIQLAVDNEVVLKLGADGMGTPAENHHVGPMHPDYAELPPIRRDPGEGEGARWPRPARPTSSSS